MSFSHKKIKNPSIYCNSEHLYAENESLKEENESLKTKIEELTLNQINIEDALIELSVMVTSTEE